MKKSLFIIFLTLVTLFSYSQKVPSSIVNITQSGNAFIVNFTLPNYTIKDTSLLEPYGISEIFKFIEIDYFGFFEDIGYPQLPQLTFDLRVPPGSKNFQISSTNVVTEIKSTDFKRFMPSQDEYELQPEFQIINDYYNSDGSLFNFNSKISEPYIVFGESGISFSIFPFTYNPSSNSITVLKQATFTITYAPLKKIIIPVSNPTKDSYLSEFFENYTYVKSGSDFNGRYLMITAPQLESTLTYFANYKRNLGYIVNVVNTNLTGRTKDEIKNYIQGQYNNSATRPDFVLLIGDHGDIPASGGNPSSNDIDDPITDLNYARLAGDDYFADVFLGRFSVSSTLELNNIISKTIIMETNIHSFEKKAKFVAGAESNSWMEYQFENEHTEVVYWTFEPLGYICQKLNQPNLSEAIGAISDNPLFYIYSGHGYFTYFSGGSFIMSGSDINSATNSVYPFVFSFACLTGNYAYSLPCIGENWIRSQKGGVTFFGPSVNSYISSDRAIEDKILGDAIRDEEHISSIINLGMKRYWKRFFSLLNRKRTRRYMQAYNLLGDPSLNILGTGCIANFTFNNIEIFNSGNVITYRAANNIQNNSSFKIYNGAKVTLIAGNSIILNPGFSADIGAVFEAGIEPCTND